jgi:hypothetical protein
MPTWFVKDEQQKIMASAEKVQKEQITLSMSTVLFQYLKCWKRWQLSYNAQSGS